MKLNDKNIEDLLNIGYSIKTDVKSITIDKDVLISIINKVFKYGLNHAVKGK